MCDTNFNWGNYYIGQKDVALTKSGEGCFNATKAVVESVDTEFADLPDLIDAEGDQPSIWDRVFFSCTDGASSSSPLHLLIIIMNMLTCFRGVPKHVGMS